MQLQHALVAALTGSVAGHIHMVDPPPISSQENKYSGYNIDYDIDSPLSGMSQYPCKNVLQYLGQKEGTPVTTYAPGGSYTMKIGTGATHDGGSCQLSLSYDKGESFTVIKSIIGNCPTAGGTWDFDIPSDAPEGDAVFSWSWINHTGNREFYHNCASVTIGSGGGSKKAREVSYNKNSNKRQSSFNSLPQIFVANLGGEYCVPEGIDVVYPNPGPSVENTSNSPGNAQYCESGDEVPGGSAPSPEPEPEPTSSSTAAPEPTATATSTSIPGGIHITSTPPAPTPTPSSTPTPPSSPAPPAPTGGSPGEKSGACSPEGAYNCLSGGKTYQRCASGSWTGVMPLAAGTQCQEGTASTLRMAGRRGVREVPVALKV